MSTTSGTQLLVKQCSDPAGMSDTSSRVKANQYTKFTRTGSIQPGQPLWTDPDHMTFTRLTPERVEPDVGAIATNVGTMVLVIGLVAGLLSLTF